MRLLDLLSEERAVDGIFAFHNLRSLVPLAPLGRLRLERLRSLSLRSLVLLARLAPTIPACLQCLIQAVFFLLLLLSLLLGFPLGFLPLLMPSSSRTNCQALHGPTLCFVASVSEYDLMFPDLEA